MRLVTAGSALECPCTIWLPAMHCIQPLYIWHPAAHSTIYPCATIQPASIEVTLEKSVRAALKRNVGIATEQPLLPVSLSRLSRQCDFLTRKRLDNRHEEASLVCRESTVLDKEQRQKLLRHYDIRSPSKRAASSISLMFHLSSRRYWAAAIEDHRDLGITCLLIR